MVWRLGGKGGRLLRVPRHERVRRGLCRLRAKRGVVGAPGPHRLRCRSDGRRRVRGHRDEVHLQVWKRIFREDRCPAQLATQGGVLSTSAHIM